MVKMNNSQIKNNVMLAHNLYISRKNPISLVHFVTNRCNARCSFCFIDFEDPDVFKGELSLNEIDVMTKNLGPNLQNVNLTGGEPFARKDFIEISECYFKNTNIKSIFVTSNGSLPDRVNNYLSTLSIKYPDRKILMQFSIDDLPTEHDKIRKIDGLFENCIKSYKLAENYGENIQSSIAITISHENYMNAETLYDYLIKKHKVKSITLNIVRDEGVYKIPSEHKLKILEAYKNLSQKVNQDMKNGILHGWNNESVQGRMMNKKNEIWRDILLNIYINDDYITPCRAGSIFGVIEANGKVKPCEILDTSFGNLRDYEYNLMKLWTSKESTKKKTNIISSKCKCHYDCAWSFNILANKEFQKQLLPSVLPLKKNR
jgi:MoaA/NifB/PqqE/SkfB family radical SAM enzyme